jgi:tRNA threonylcarbamoyladenosine biosynthesis protein TsaB
VAPVVLVLDASTQQGTVAVFRDGRCVADATVAMRGANEERLMPAVATVLADATAAIGDLERVVCGAGPGSFTSLRIAASIAKGLAFAAGRPMHAVPSLALDAAGRGEGRWAVTLDALRGESFVAVYEVAHSECRELVPARIAGNDAIAGVAAAAGASVVAAAPHARAAGAIPGALTGGTAVDLATWEPDYGRKAEAQVKWEVAHGRPLAP